MVPSLISLVVSVDVKLIYLHGPTVWDGDSEVVGPVGFKSEFPSPRLTRPQ